jgi:hypothetical protein
MKVAVLYRTETKHKRRQMYCIPGDRLTVSCGCMGDVGLLTANWFIEGAEVLDLDVPRNPEMLRLSISIFRLPELVHVLPIWQTKLQPISYITCFSNVHLHRNILILHINPNTTTIKTKLQKDIKCNVVPSYGTQTLKALWPLKLLTSGLC